MQMARWRTLHEIVEAKKSFGQYQQCRSKLGYIP